MWLKYVETIIILGLIVVSQLQRREIHRLRKHISKLTDIYFGEG